MSIDAEIITSRFTSLDEFALRGVNNEIAKDAVVTLQRGTTQPVTPPSVSIGWNSVNVADSLGISPYWYGLAWVSGTSAWYAADLFGVPQGSLQQFNPSTGASVGASFPLGVDPLGGVTYLGTSLYVLGKRVSGQFGQIHEWWVEQYTTAGVKQNEWRLSSVDFAYVPAIGNDGTNLLLSLYYSGAVHIQTRVPSTGAFVGSALMTSATSPQADSAAILYGSFDFGANRYVWIPRQPGAVARVFNTSGVEQVGEQFPAAEGAKVAGMGWDGTNFRSLTQGSPTLRTYTGIRNTASPWWVGNTWRRADATGPDFAQYETKLGSPRKFTMSRRANVLVTTAPIPAGAGGPDSADSTTLYLGTGASQPTNANFFRRATPAVGVSSVQFTTMDFTGGNPPISGNFPNANPARIVSDDPSLLDIDGNGNIVAPKKMQCGTATLSFPGGTATVTVAVSLPVAFGSTPIVTATAQRPADVVCGVLSKSASGFTIQGRHSDNATTITGSVAVDWIAMVP